MYKPVNGTTGTRPPGQSVPLRGVRQWDSGLCNRPSPAAPHAQQILVATRTNPPASCVYDRAIVLPVNPLATSPKQGTALLATADATNKDARPCTLPHSPRSPEDPVSYPLTSTQSRLFHPAFVNSVAPSPSPCPPHPNPRLTPPSTSATCSLSAPSALCAIPPAFAPSALRTRATARCAGVRNAAIANMSFS
jgi:hypothetical protein